MGRHSKHERSAEAEGVLTYYKDVQDTKWYRGQKVIIKKRVRPGIKEKHWHLAEEEFTVVESHRDHVVLTNGKYNMSFRKADLYFGATIEDY